MKVLVLGGTGSIGAAVVDALLLRGHEVIALARSEAAVKRLAAIGVRTLQGDLRDPKRWIASVDSVDAIVHAAAQFGPDNATVDRAVLKALLSQLGGAIERKTLLYTGGCWLYSATGDRVATETSPLQPPAAFHSNISSGS